MQERKFHLESWVWGEWEFDGTRETLFLFWVIISKTDLKFDCFNEFTLLSVRNHFMDGLLEGVWIDFATLQDGGYGDAS